MGLRDRFGISPAAGSAEGDPADLIARASPGSPEEPTSEQDRPPRRRDVRRADKAKDREQRRTSRAEADAVAAELASGAGRLLAGDDESPYRPQPRPVPPGHPTHEPDHWSPASAPASAPVGAQAFIPVPSRQVSTAYSGLSPVQRRARPQDPPPPGPWDEVVIDRPIGRFEPRATKVSQYVPDLIVDGWTSGSLSVRLASIRGYAHRHDGSPRQDDAVVCVHPATGAVLVAVADGVSAAPLSHVGSRHACRRAIKGMLEDLDRHGAVQWDELLDQVAVSLEHQAGQLAGLVTSGSAEDLVGTTLVLAVVRPHPGGATVDLAQVGDSAAWVLGPAGFSALLTPKTSADAQIVNSAVAALPRRPVPWRHDSVSLTAGQVLLLGTDGFGDPLGDGTGLVGDLFAGALRTPPPPLRFAHLLDFSRETFDDDRTLVAVWPAADGSGTTR
jgi:hypothetical protein